MSTRSRSLALMVAMLPLFVVVVAATGVPAPLRALFGALLAGAALVAIARVAASGRD